MVRNGLASTTALWLLLAAPIVHAAQDADPGGRLVLVAALANETVNPVTARFIIRAIETAAARGAECLVLRLDTPGGLLDSTRDISKAILDSRVPVIVYVAPPGGRAASAGLFITLAAHVAAMAPGTNIGAAHPVPAGGLPAQQPESPRNESPGGPASPTDAKAVQDTVAWARALAELRGRDPEWVTAAVVESASAPASEALSRGIVDLLADDLQQLLAELDGREVALTYGTTVLRLASPRVEQQEMWWGEQLLSGLANPNLAFLLLIIGFYGILFELYTPGWGVGGTVGVICLVLGFFAMAILPINYVGLALIGVGLALFVAEAFAATSGLLAIAGAACVAMGGLMLIDSPDEVMRVSPWLLLPVTAGTAFISVFLVSQVLVAHRTQAQTGAEALLAAPAVADGAFAPAGDRFTGWVHLHGELWRAESAVPIAPGQRLKVERRDGLTLFVAPE